MLIIILSVLILITSWVLYILFNKKYNNIDNSSSSYYRSYRQYHRERDRAEALSIGFFVTAITASIVVGILLLVSSITFISKPSNYLAAIEEKNSLEARLEIYYTSNKEIDFKDIDWQDLYKDIARFNTTVRKHQYWHKNIFVGWYYNKKIAEFKPIEYK